MVYMTNRRDEFGARQAVQPDPNLLAARTAVRRVRQAVPLSQRPGMGPPPAPNIHQQPVQQPQIQPAGGRVYGGPLQPHSSGGTPRTKQPGFEMGATQYGGPPQRHMGTVPIAPDPRGKGGNSFVSRFGQPAAPNIHQQPNQQPQIAAAGAAAPAAPQPTEPHDVAGWIKYYESQGLNAAQQHEAMKKHVAAHRQHYGARSGFDSDEGSTLYNLARGRLSPGGWNLGTHSDDQIRYWLSQNGFTPEQIAAAEWRDNINGGTFANGQRINFSDYKRFEDLPENIRNEMLARARNTRDPAEAQRQEQERRAADSARMRQEYESWWRKQEAEMKALANDPTWVAANGDPLEDFYRNSGRTPGANLGGENGELARYGRGENIYGQQDPNDWNAMVNRWAEQHGGGASIIGGNGPTGTGRGGGREGFTWDPDGTMRDGTGARRSDPRQAGPGGGGPGGGAGGFNGRGGTQGDMNALRRQIIQGTYDPRYEQEQRDLVAGARVNAPRAIAGTDLTGARGYAGRAAGEVGNVQAGTVEDLAGTDLARARQALEAYRSSIGDVRLTENHERVDNPLMFNPSAASARARELTSGGLESLYSAPDRQQIAMETLRLAREEAEPQFRQRLRSVAQRAAALGRTRSGMTTNDLTGLEQDERDRENRLRRSVVNDAASQTMGDRLARLSASQGVAGQFRGEDLAEAGFNQGLRQERRGERGFWAGLDSERAGLAAQRAGLLDTVTGRETEQANIRRRDGESDREYRARQEQARAQAAAQRAGLLMNLGSQEADFAGITRRDAESDREMDFRVGSTNAGLNLDRARVLGGMDAQRFGAETQLRDELRGERGRGDSLAQQAIENERQRRLMEEGLLDSRTNRALRVAQAREEAGGQRERINALLALIQRGGEGSQEAIQELMRLYGQRRAQGG